MSDDNVRQEQLVRATEELVKELLGAVSSPMKLVKFIERLAYNGALSTIADADFRTAKRLIAESPKAVNKKAQIESVKNLLESAHTGYAQWNTWTAKAFSHIFAGSHLVHCRKDGYTCCLLAICYLYLGEKKIALQRAEDAKAAIIEGDRVMTYMWSKQGISAVGVFIPPVSLASAIVLIGNSVDGLLTMGDQIAIPWINKQQIMEFVEQIKKIKKIR